MWAFNIANRIIKNNPNKNEYILNCGTSTTGVSHIGNFREISIVYFVKRALEIKGKKARVILSFDDFDRFKKVPTGIDNSYSKFIAMPVCDIPSPYCENKSFAQYYEDLFLKELNDLEIDVQPINQYVRYKGGDYNSYYKSIFNKRKDIAQIINKFKTEPTENDEKFLPFSIYCENCNKDLVTINKIDDKKDSVEYVCDVCGAVNNINVDSNRLKPIFKVEWPMRWVYEGVDFEPSGRSHMTKNGAFDVACDICTNIFQGKSPIAEVYEFVELKGSTNRMSKTSGKTYTITDMLKIYSTKMLLWMFAKQHPNQAIVIDFGDDVLKNYFEYEKFLKSSQDNDILIKKLLNIDENELASSLVSFKTLVTEICAFTKEEDIIKKYSKDKSSENVVAKKLQYAFNWVEINNKRSKLLSNVNSEYVASMTEEQKQQVKIIKDSINDYQKGPSIPLKNVMRNKIDALSNFNLKESYKDFYNLIFGEDKGAPIEKIVNHFDIKDILNLLEI